MSNQKKNQKFRNPRWWTAAILKIVLLGISAPCDSPVA